MPTDLPTMLSSPDLTAPAAVERSRGFSPSIRQKYLKAIAVQESEKGKGFLRDWIRYTRFCPFPGGEATHTEWREWLKQDGFKVWCYDFPYPRTVSEEDIESMDHTFWQAMRNNLGDGDNQSMQLYAKITGKLNKSDEDEGANTAVIAWLKDGAAGAAAWSGQPKGIADDKG